MDIAECELSRKTQVTQVKDILPGEVKITEPRQMQIEDADGKLTLRAAHRDEGQSAGEIDARPHQRPPVSAHASPQRKRG